MHHDLHAVAVAAHVGMADELDALGRDGFHDGLHAALAALAPAILPNTEPLVSPEPPG